MSEVRNLVVYMADGLRWDHHPEDVSKMGPTFRTVASSLHTPTAIASMLSGRYLPGHGVHGFTDVLPSDVSTVLDLFDNRGLSDSPGNFNETIYGTLLQRYDQTPLSELDEPFGWFMRDAGGHAPYDGFDERLQTDESVRSYLADHGGDVERMRRDYRASVDSSVERFRRFVLDPLRDRGLLDRTLVVFISDHGQLLGEYGHVGESYPACPEVVYVPTTLIHPSLPDVDETGLFRHVDLLPTVAGLLSTPVEETDGVDVFASGLASQGACLYDRPYPWPTGEFSYTIESLWDVDGGHVFVRSGLWDKLRVTAGLLTRIPAGIHVRRARSMRGLKMLFENHRTWGDPSMSVAAAEEALDALTAEDGPETDLTLTDETEQNLRELGYL